MLPLSFIRISKTDATRLQRLQNRFHCLLCGKDCKKSVSPFDHRQKEQLAKHLHTSAEQNGHILHNVICKKVKSGRFILPHVGTLRRLNTLSNKAEILQNTKKKAHIRKHMLNSRLMSEFIYCLLPSLRFIFYLYESMSPLLICLNISSCVLSFNVILLYRPTVYCLLCLSQCCQSLIVIFFRINTNYYYYYFFVFLVKTNTPFSWTNNHKPGCIVYT